MLKLISFFVNFCSPFKIVPSLPAGQAKPEGVWIDVRTPEEFNLGYLEGSLNIPVDVITQHIERVVPNKDTPVYLYCRSGRRSGIAAEVLSEMGYTKALNYGGYEELLAKGYK